MSRTAGIYVRVIPEIEEKMQYHADKIGIKKGALAAYIIGTWVKQQEEISSCGEEAVCGLPAGEDCPDHPCKECKHYLEN